MIKAEDVKWIGQGLERPECVLAHGSGLFLVPDWAGNGGVCIITPDGKTHHIEARWPEKLRPNGIALEPGGAILLAHLGEETGGLFRMDHEGHVEPVLTEIDGHPLPPCNFPLLDHEGRIWLSISTTIRPRADDYRKGAKTGFIVLIDKKGARVVADGLGYANECLISADGSTLYVNETFARRSSAFSIGPNGTLSDQRVVAEWGPGIWPDGMAADCEGGLWISSILSNRVIRLSPEGEQEIMLEDFDAAHLAEAEEAWAQDRLGRVHLDQIRSKQLRNISSLAFYGPELDRFALGCLLGDRLATYKSPVKGLEPVHWRADPGPLGKFTAQGE